ncbi:MAG: hypothetical protein VX278_00575, partial [Myxococcota bacterium]|nr:hypothetical protein [Myxococcota bacterium]
SNRPAQYAAADSSLSDLSFQYWSLDMNIPTEEMCFIVGKGQRHCEEAWRERLPVALQFLFQPVP